MRLLGKRKEDNIPLIGDNNEYGTSSGVWNREYGTIRLERKPEKRSKRSWPSSWVKPLSSLSTVKLSFSIQLPYFWSLFRAKKTVKCKMAPVTHTHSHTHACTHAHTHTHTHTCTCTCTGWPRLSVSKVDTCFSATIGSWGERPCSLKKTSEPILMIYASNENQRQVILSCQILIIVLL